MAKLMEKLPGNNASAGAEVEITMSVIGGKWKGIILFHLAKEETRFNQLRRLIPGITQRMLTLQLRELEKDGIVERIAYQEIPPRVGYRLSELGYSLMPLIHMMRQWGEEYSQR
jgi:Predicted transcriptional regulators